MVRWAQLWRRTGKALEAQPKSEVSSRKRAARAVGAETTATATRQSREAVHVRRALCTDAVRAACNSAEYGVEGVCALVGRVRAEALTKRTPEHTRSRGTAGLLKS